MPRNTQKRDKFFLKKIKICTYVLFWEGCGKYTSSSRYFFSGRPSRLGPILYGLGLGQRAQPAGRPVAHSSLCTRDSGTDSAELLGNLRRPRAAARAQGAAAWPAPHPPSPAMRHLSTSEYFWWCNIRVSTWR